jgi:hypothetical protein
MERDFKGVWIPKEIWLNEDLGWSEKLLLVEIDSLARNGECFASNEHFAKFLRLSKKRVSELITELHRSGYVTVELTYKQGSKEIEKRVIRPLAEKRYTPSGKPLDPIAKNNVTPIAENRVDNNTLVINTITNTMSKNTIEREFEKLWTIYPRKMGKKKAFDSFVKARKVKKVPYETIENGLYRYLRHIEDQGVEEQYIQHGSTFFNQEKWQDEFITTGVNRKPKNAMEYMKMKYGQGEEPNEPNRNGEVIDYYTTLIPEPFQGF